MIEIQYLIVGLGRMAECFDIFKIINLQLPNYEHHCYCHCYCCCNYYRHCCCRPDGVARDRAEHASPRLSRKDASLKVLRTTRFFI